MQIALGGGRTGDAWSLIPSRFRPRSIRSRLLVLIVIVSLVSGGGFATILAISIESAPHDEARADAASALMQDRSTLRSSLQHLHTDVVALASTAAVSELSQVLAQTGSDGRAPENAAVVDRVATTFEGFALKEYFDQIRYLDASGREIVRVDSGPGGSLRSPRSALQDKGDRPYFIAAQSTPPGEVALSALDLNVENGQIQVPHTPVVRLSAPIYVGGAFRGAVIVNVFADWFLAFVDQDADVILVDGDGQYLLHPDDTKRFGTQLRTGQSLVADYGPEEALRLMQATADVREEDGRYVAHGKVVLDGFSTDNQWVLLTSVPRPPFAWGTYSAFATISLLGLGLALGGAYLVSRQVTAPLDAIEDAAEHIAAGELAFAIPGTDRDDKLGALANSLARMTSSLVRANEVLETRVLERTSELEHEVGEHRAARSRLAQSNFELTAANTELDAFAYSVSHDLRAPLRAIDGFSQTLLRDYEETFDERGRDRLQRVRAAAQRLGTMIDDILRLSRATRTDLQPRTVDLSEQARAILDELHAGDPGRVVETRVEDGLLVEADPALLRAVFQNLLQNAWKFTSQHPRATIEVGRTWTEHGAAVYVRDDGAGFDMAYAGKLFGAFQRLHTPSEFEGSGIGLATVQRIVSRHGGRVWAEGEPERGATFYLTLPMTPASMTGEEPHDDGNDW